MNSKLLELQKEISGISKDKTNPFYKSQYFDINQLIHAIKPVLNDLGLVLMQPLTNIDGKPAISTVLIDADGGDQVTSCIMLPENDDPQKMGSIITYYRRYAIQSMLLLEAVDDDANSAIPQIKSKKSEPSKLPESQRSTMITWGKKYNGKDISEVDDSYLQYIIDNAKDSHWVDAAVAEQDKRKESNNEIPF